MREVVRTNHERGGVLSILLKQTRRSFDPITTEVACYRYNRSIRDAASRRGFEPIMTEEACCISNRSTRDAASSQSRETRHTIDSIRAHETQLRSNHEKGGVLSVQLEHTRPGFDPITREDEWPGRLDPHLPGHVAHQPGASCGALGGAARPTRRPPI